jgi:hypothetical protein
MTPVTSPTISELEAHLGAARRRVERARAALTGARTGSEWHDYKRALQAQLTAERELAVARREPTCMPLAWKPLWSSGAPSPHVVSSGHVTFLVYRVDEHDPAFVGERLAIVEFKRPYAHRLGGPDDEAWHAHPLYTRGLEPYRAHVVMNSPWLAVERETAKAHPQFKAERWDALRHYLLLFHDEIFECLAEDHACDVLETNYEDALAQLATRVLLRANP